MTFKDQYVFCLITPEQPEASDRLFKSTFQNKMHIKLKKHDRYLKKKKKVA